MTGADKAPLIADAVRGYMDGQRNARAPGGQPGAYWQGRRRGLIDAGHLLLPPDAAQLVRSLRRLQAQ